MQRISKEKILAQFQAAVREFFQQINLVGVRDNEGKLVNRENLARDARVRY